MATFKPIAASPRSFVRQPKESPQLEGFDGKELSQKISNVSQAIFRDEPIQRLMKAYEEGNEKRHQELRRYLDSLHSEAKSTGEVEFTILVLDTAWQVWEILREYFLSKGLCLEVPDACPGHRDNFMYTWSKAEHYLECEIFGSGEVKSFFTATEIVVKFGEKTQHLNRVFILPFLTKLRSLLGKLSESLQIKPNLAPLPRNCCVLRLARPPKDYAEKRNILAIQLNAEFELSSKDKESVPPHLSVWAEFLTTPKQAYAFLQENAPNSPRKLIIRLKVDKIIKIVGSSGDGRRHPNLLNVVWVHLFRNLNGKQVRDCRPGAEGHCGITGLDEKSPPEGLTKAQAKLLRKDLRSKLAELASKNYSLLDDIN